MIQKYYLPVFLIGAACALRVLRNAGIIDLPPNFAPIGALALFAGAVFESRGLAIFMPIAAMAASDFFIGWYDARIMAAVYGSFALSVALGFYIQTRPSISRIARASVASSIVFFLITNAAVWLFSGMYPTTVLGLMNSYLMGVPFLKWTLVGDLFYTGTLFGAYNAVLTFVFKTRFLALPVCTLVSQAGEREKGLMTSNQATNNDQ